MQRQQNKLAWAIGGLIIAAALSRLLPHPYNFSPVAAMALFGGCTLKNRKLALLLPLGALFLSDVCMQLLTDTPLSWNTWGFYGWSQLVNYGAFLLVVLLGMQIRRIRILNVIAGSLLASLLFFVLSNLAVWLFAGGVAPYTYNMEGLVTTFVLGIPFFGNTVAGDLFFCGILFGGYYALKYVMFRRQSMAA